jgi:ssDNA-binding Zn-finger/Zn-ribbon topoisomerase 1
MADNTEPIPHWTFDQPPLYCPKCGDQMPARIWDRHSHRWVSRIACESCSINASPPEPKKKKRGGDPGQGRFDCGEIFVK